MSDLGKLKRTTSEKHSCGCPLQLRVRGEVKIGEVRSYSNEYLYCPRCDEEIEVKPKIRRIRQEEEYAEPIDTKPRRFNKPPTGNSGGGNKFRSR
jgi:hypothetical protein